MTGRVEARPVRRQAPTAAGKLISRPPVQPPARLLLAHADGDGVVRLKIYALWEQHEARLRAEIGDAATEQVLNEAYVIRPVTPFTSSFLFTVRAPG